jgi:hypothetical protein
MQFDIRNQLPTTNQIVEATILVAKTQATRHAKTSSLYTHIKIKKIVT